MHHFIVNPKSSSGKGLRIWKRIEKTLSEKQITYQVYFTNGPGHASILSAKISGKHIPCTIIAVGGDGTANEVIGGLTDYSSVRFGYIPTGSGNDLARGLSLPADPSKVLEALLNTQNVRPVNVGTVTADGFTRHFIVSSGLGFDAAVCHEVMRSRMKKLLNHFRLGKLIYLFVALKQLFLIKPCRMSITLDNQETVVFDRIFFAAAMNTKYEGGGFMFCPDASPDDDMLDICVIEKIPRLKILYLLPTAFSGRHTKYRGVHILKCRHARIVCDRPAALHADGEPCGHQTDVAVSLAKKRLPFIVS